MLADWQELTLGNLGRIVTGKTPPGSIPGAFGGDIPFVTPSDMDGRKIITTTDRYLTDTGGETIRGSRLPAGAVMISCIGSDMGKAAVAGRDCVTNQQINSIIVDDSFSGEFVYYNLSNRRHELRHQAAAGSAQPILNKGDFSRLEIKVPPLPEQKAIAAVLGALDDKIELNRRMNATLEALARTLFQSWFVDFDPVRAKLDGRQPTGLDHTTAALFPNEFEDSELGSIPKGWNLVSLPEAIDVNPRRKLQPGTVASYLDMKNMPTQGHCPDEVIQREFTSGTKFQDGDTLLARITPSLEKGKTAFVDFLKDEEVGWGSTEYIVLAAKPPLPPQSVYLLARSDALRAHAIQNMTGTTTFKSEIFIVVMNIAWTYLLHAYYRKHHIEYRYFEGGLQILGTGALHQCLADQLKYALATYTQSGGKGSPSIDTAKAIAVMLEKHEIACDMMHGFDWSKWHTGTPAEKMSLLPGAQEHILQQENGKERFVQVVTELLQAFALCAGTDDAIAIRDDIGFFQQVKIALAKPRAPRKTTEELDHAVRQLVAKAIAPEGEIIDVFSAAGLKQPDISILSDQFLAEVRELKYKDVAAELLAKLLGDEIKSAIETKLSSEPRILGDAQEDPQRLS
jgi:type I restriction enzyme S subunit